MYWARRILVSATAWSVFAFSVFTSSVFAEAPHAIQDDKQKKTVNPLYESWHKYGVGTSVTLKTEMKQGGNIMTNMKQIHKMVEKSDEEVEIEIATVIIANGTETPGPTNKMTIKKYAPIVDPTKPPQDPKAKVTKGKETIKLIGKSHKCEWVQTSMNVNGMDVTTKVWSCNEIPGTFVKSETKSAGVDTTSLLVKFDKK